MQPVYLASSSPRRQALMKQLGIPFIVLEHSVDEVLKEELPIERRVEALAERKARSAAEKVAQGLIVAADTVVVWQDRILGKPADEHEAQRMLKLLQGSVHEVFTGLAVMEKPGGQVIVTHQRTRVKFRPVTEEEIRDYVATKEPLDKAGAYAAQGLGAIFIAHIEGCYFNVVGLPLASLAQILREFGLDVLRGSSP